MPDNAKLEIPNCPECKEEPEAIIHEVHAACEIQKDAEGRFYFEGTTEILWDHSKMVRDSEGRVEVACVNKHTWFSRIEGTP